MEKSSSRILPGIDKILEDFFWESECPKEVIANTKRMILHVIPDHYMSSLPSIFPEFCKILKPNVTKEELELANSLGWISQMFQSYGLAFDDFNDDGNQRYNKVTWSKLHSHSKSVILPDLMTLRSIAFFTLRTKFSHLSIYLQLLQLCVDSEISYYKGVRLEKEQMFEGLRHGKSYLESFNIESYKLVSSAIGDPYLNLPIALAMTLCGFQMSEYQSLYQSVKKICDIHTHVLQFADDYLEIFGPDCSLDKNDADFRKGRLSWLFFMAKESCVSTNQFADLLKHYGNDNDESVIFVTKFLEKNGIVEQWKEFRKNSTENIEKEIDISFVGYPEVKELIKFYFGHWEKYMC